MTPEVLGQLVLTVGIGGTMVIFHAWYSIKRENSMSDRIREVENEKTQILVDQLGVQSELLNRNVLVMEKSIGLIETLDAFLREVIRNGEGGKS